MTDEVITIYCIVDDTLKAMNIKDDPQAKMPSSEVLTTAVAACLFFGGNFRKTLKFMSLLCSYVLSESRFIRRLRKLNKRVENIFEVIVSLFETIYEAEDLMKEFDGITLMPIRRLEERTSGGLTFLNNSLLR